MVSFIFQIAYLVMLFIFVVMSFFIVYHVLRFSHNKGGGILMLCVFLAVMASLVVANMTLFSQLRLDRIFTF